MTQDAPPVFLSILRNIGAQLGTVAQNGEYTFETAIALALPDTFWESFDFTQLETAGDALRDLAVSEEVPKDGKAAALEIIDLITASKTILTELKALTAKAETEAAKLTDVAKRDALLAVLPKLQRRVIGQTVSDLLLENASGVHLVLLALGVIIHDRVDDPDLDYFIDRWDVDTDALLTLLKDPLGTLRNPYRWGESDFDPKPFFEFVMALEDDMTEATLTTTDDGAPLIKMSNVEIYRDDETDPPGLAMTWAEGLGGEIRFGHEIGDDFIFETTLSGGLDGAVTLRIAPPLNATLEAAASAEVAIELAALREANVEPLSLFGDEDSTIQVTLAKPEARMGIAGKTDNTGKVVLDPTTTVGVKGLSFRIDPSKGDGFLANILGGVALEPTADVALKWTPRDRLTVDISGGMEAAIPLGQDLGPVELRTLILGMGLGENDALLRLDAGLEVAADIGPVQGTLERVGARLRLVEGSDADLPVSASFDFLPPRGLGLAIEAGPAKGGGYLSFDPERGRYSGAIELQIDKIGLSAVGLLTTSPPDGFSLMVILTAQFPPIPLGFGFSLNGLGGLIGINRTSDVDALRSGLKSRSLDAIMFPKDPVKRAPEIVRTAEQVFPARSGQHVFGPMAKLGWGTPPIISAELGLILELDSPLRLILLGKLRAAFPTLAVELRAAEINMDLLGIIDFDRQEASLDAVLYDSRVAIYSLEGEMAMRLRWGNAPFFALSIGGVHPAFERPPELPDLRRVAISLGGGDNPRLRLEAFLALTSNTVQFGARLDARAAAMGFVAEGWLAFDALIQLDPFAFVVNLGGGFALKRGGSTMMTVQLRLRLTGPSPFVASGVAKASLFFIDVEVPFRATFGKKGSIGLPKVNAAAELHAALKDGRNWSSKVPQSLNALATLRDTGAGILHPAAPLGVRQQTLPFSTPLELFGGTAIEGARYFELAEVSNGTDPFNDREVSVIEEHFAPAQIFEMTENEKLAAPSFEKMPAGAQGFGGQGWAGPNASGDAATERDMKRRTTFIDAPEFTFDPADPTLIAASARQAAPPPKAQHGSKFTLEEARYALVDSKTLSPLSATGNRRFADIPELATQSAETYAGARAALRAHVSRHPADRDALKIVARHELEAA